MQMSLYVVDLTRSTCLISHLFQVMLCNFSARPGSEVVSFHHLAVRKRIRVWNWLFRKTLTLLKTLRSVLHGDPPVEWENPSKDCRDRYVIRLQILNRLLIILSSIPSEDKIIYRQLSIRGDCYAVSWGWTTNFNRDTWSASNLFNPSGIPARPLGTTSTRFGCSHSFSWR